MNALTNNTVVDSADLTSRLDQLEQGVCVVNIVSQAACGEKSLPKVKVELDGQLQDSDTIKGSKIRWFPKEPLNFVNKSKQAISRTLNAYGVRWGDMTIVPLARLDDLQSEIEAIQIEWQRDLDAMLFDFENLVSDWHMNNLDVADIMRRYTMDKNEFGGRFKLKMLPPVAFKPLIDKDDVEAGEDLANSMLDNLYDEVAKMAGDVYDRSFFTKNDQGHKVLRTRANRRIKDSFKTLIQKLNGLSFLDSNIEKVIGETHRVLDSMPKTGWIENNDLAALARWTLVLSSSDSLKNHANDDVIDYEDEVIVDDIGVLGEEVSNNLDEDLNFDAQTSPDLPIKEESDLIASMADAFNNADTLENSDVIADVAEETTSNEVEEMDDTVTYFGEDFTDFEGTDELTAELEQTEPEPESEEFGFGF